MGGRQVSPGILVEVRGHMPNTGKAVKNGALLAAGSPCVRTCTDEERPGGFVAWKTSRSVRSYKRGLVTGFRDVDFRDGKTGLLRCGFAQTFK
jgi:hypothetical protein